MTMKPFVVPNSYTPCHYTTNRALLANTTVNATFDSVLRMDDAAWVAWLEQVRQAILTSWDSHNVPPRIGLSDAEVEFEWDRFVSTDADSVWTNCDDGTEALSAPPASHSVISQWFPTMMKTRINTSEKKDGISIYDMFAQDAVWNRYRTSYATRHFRRDSFFAYSRAIHTHESVPGTSVVAATAYEYLTTLRDSIHSATSDLFGDAVPPTHGLWLSPAIADDEYDGYSSHIKDRSVWTVSQSDAAAWKASDAFPAHWFAAVTATPTKKSHYMLRLYETDARIFPHGFRSFRISMCQYAVNWPAVAARALYERYTTGVKSPVIWDPSAGWAGRLAGAITSRTKPLYISCDPNTDHLWTDEAGVQHSKYTEIAAFHASRTLLDTCPVVMHFPCGSETMQDQPAFQPYQGKVDVVFTSPPYFGKELYSDDPEQSARKFSAFEDWCEGFLRPTIETAAKWLKPGGVLLWNIADIKFGNKLLPLEQRSLDYAAAAGLVQEPTIRLLLGNMPGGNRVNEDGTGTAKNTCKVGGRLVKFEPIFCFRKPL